MHRLIKKSHIIINFPLVNNKENGEDRKKENKNCLPNDKEKNKDEKFERLKRNGRWARDEEMG